VSSRVTVVSRCWPSDSPNLGAQHGEVAEAFIDVHHRADEVDANLLRSTSPEDVGSELAHILTGPGVGCVGRSG